MFYLTSICSLVLTAVKEPMAILLLVTSTIYFVTGNIGDGIFLAAAIILVAAISLYQDSRSRNALENLKELTQAYVKGIRKMVEEWAQVAADGTVIHSNDFSVEQSLLSGEFKRRAA